MTDESCKRCLLLESAEVDVYKKVEEYISKITPDEKTGKEEYERRIEICRNCDNLISGTCLKCGCYVEFRAAFKNRRCPDNKGGKW